MSGKKIALLAALLAKTFQQKVQLQTAR